MVYSLNNIRDENITLFDDLFIEFSKLELTRFYSAKSKNFYTINHFRNIVIMKRSEQQ